MSTDQNGQGTMPPAPTGMPGPMPEMEGLDPKSSDYPQKLADKIFASMDTNADGAITQAESKLPADVFSRISVDGKVTKAALIQDITAQQAAMQPPQSPPSGASPPADLAGLDPTSSDFAQKLAEKMFSSMDVNADGVVTATESKLPTDVFNSLAVDGKLTLDALVKDIQAKQAAIDAKMGPPPGTPPGQSGLAQGPAQLAPNIASGAASGPLPDWQNISLTGPSLTTPFAGGPSLGLIPPDKTQAILAQG